MVQCIPNGVGSLHLRCQRQWLRCLSQTSYTPKIVCNQERSILNVYTAKTVYSCFVIKLMQGSRFEWQTMAVSMHGPKQCNLYRNQPELSRYTYRNMLPTKVGAKPFHFRKDECSYKRIMHFHWQFLHWWCKGRCHCQLRNKDDKSFFYTALDQMGPCSNVIVLYICSISEMVNIYSPACHINFMKILT